MRLLQLFFLVLFWVFIARFWKTENIKLFMLAFFFLCLAVV